MAMMKPKVSTKHQISLHAWTASVILQENNPTALMITAVFKNMNAKF